MSLTGDRAQWIAERMQLSREEAVVAGEVMDEGIMLRLWEKRWDARHPRESFIFAQMKMDKLAAESGMDEWDEAESEVEATKMWESRVRMGLEKACPEPDMDLC